MNILKGWNYFWVLLSTHSDGAHC